MAGRAQKESRTQDVIKMLENRRRNAEAAGQSRGISQWENALECIRKYPREIYTIGDVCEAAKRRPGITKTAIDRIQRAVFDEEEELILPLPKRRSSWGAGAGDGGAAAAAAAGGGGNDDGKPSGYIPGLRTGAYAILLTLYRQGGGPMTKDSIVNKARGLCDASFDVPNHGWQTAWSGNKTLVERGLITRDWNSRRSLGQQKDMFRITDKGRRVAEYLEGLTAGHTPHRQSSTHVPQRQSGGHVSQRQSGGHAMSGRIPEPGLGLSEEDADYDWAFDSDAMVMLRDEDEDDVSEAVDPADLQQLRAMFAEHSTTQLEQALRAHGTVVQAIEALLEIDPAGVPTINSGVDRSLHPTHEPPSTPAPAVRPRSSTLSGAAASSSAGPVGGRSSAKRSSKSQVADARRRAGEAAILRQEAAKRQRLEDDRKVAATVIVLGDDVEETETDARSPVVELLDESQDSIEGGAECKSPVIELLDESQDLEDESEQDGSLVIVLDESQEQDQFEADQEAEAEVVEVKSTGASLGKRKRVDTEAARSFSWR